jgi:hypothetical protein
LVALHVIGSLNAAFWSVAASLALVGVPATLPNEDAVADKVATDTGTAIAAATVNKKKEDTINMRIGICDEWKRRLIKAPAKFESGPATLQRGFWDGYHPHSTKSSTRELPFVWNDCVAVSRLRPMSPNSN